MGRGESNSVWQSTEPPSCKNSPLIVVSNAQGDGWMGITKRRR